LAVNKINTLLSDAEKAVPLTLLPDQPSGQYSDQPEWYDFENASTGVCKNHKTIYKQPVCVDKKQSQEVY